MNYKFEFVKNDAHDAFDVQCWISGRLIEAGWPVINVLAKVPSFDNPDGLRAWAHATVVMRGRSFYSDGQNCHIIDEVKVMRGGGIKIQTTDGKTWEPEFIEQRVTI